MKKKQINSMFHEWLKSLNATPINIGPKFHGVILQRIHPLSTLLHLPLE